MGPCEPVQANFNTSVAGEPGPIQLEMAVCHLWLSELACFQWETIFLDLV